jgi:hypothetical protein
MLINKKIAENDIVTLKLVTNEEIVGKVTAITDTAIEIRKPLLLTLTMDQNGPSVSMVPFWLLSAEDEPVTINRSNVLVLVKTAKGAADAYMQHTTSLVMPGHASGLIHP